MSTWCKWSEGRAPQKNRLQLQQPPTPSMRPLSLSFSLFLCTCLSTTRQPFTLPPAARQACSRARAPGAQFVLAGGLRKRSVVSHLLDGRLTLKSFDLRKQVFLGKHDLFKPQIATTLSFSHQMETVNVLRVQSHLHKTCLCLSY